MSNSSRNLRRGRSWKRVPEAPPLFADVKAWFSSSVSHDTKLAWIKHGGHCGDWQEAQLLFSEDVKAKDTMALFEQMEFLWGYVTVFHASFITACIKEKDMKNVSVAAYLMLPPEYPLVDTKDVPGGSSQTTVPTRRDRDQVVDPLSAIVRHSSRRKRRLQLSKRSIRSLSSARIQNNTYAKYQPCGSCEKSFQFCNGVEESSLEDDMPYSDLRSIPHVNTLKRTSLPLSDFIPQQNGCTVSRKV